MSSNLVQTWFLSQLKQNHSHQPHLRFRQQTLQNQIWQFHTALHTVFYWRSTPLFYCFIEFTSSFRSLNVLNKSSSCWLMACNWKATPVFCVTDLLFSEILWICKILLVAQNISSHLSCFTQKSRLFTLICSVCRLLTTCFLLVLRSAIQL